MQRPLAVVQRPLTVEQSLRTVAKLDRSDGNGYHAGVEARRPKMLECATRRYEMGDKIKVYQKPTCSKCREAIGVLKERGADFESINYYEAPLTEKDLKALIKKLGIAPRELLRKNEQ